MGLTGYQFYATHFLWNYVKCVALCAIFTVVILIVIPGTSSVIALFVLLAYAASAILCAIFFSTLFETGTVTVHVVRHSCL